jgi:hypothetical protein
MRTPSFSFLEASPSLVGTAPRSLQGWPTQFGELNLTGDPVWIDDGWLDAIVVLSLTCFVLCLMGLGKVRQDKARNPA